MKIMMMMMMMMNYCYTVVSPPLPRVLLSSVVGLTSTFFCILEDLSDAYECGGNNVDAAIDPEPLNALNPTVPTATLVTPVASGPPTE